MRGAELAAWIRDPRPMMLVNALIANPPTPAVVYNRAGLLKRLRLGRVVMP